jgi:hypothetical protein
MCEWELYFFVFEISFYLFGFLAVLGQTVCNKNKVGLPYLKNII